MVLVDTNSYRRAEVWCRKVEVLIYACSGQILTLVKTATHVPQHQKHLKWKTNSTYQLDHCGSREPYPEFTLDSRSLSDIRNCQFLLRLTLDLRSFSNIRNCQTPLWLYLFGIIHLDIQLGRNHLTSWRPRPPQQKPSADSPASTLDIAQW